MPPTLNAVALVAPFWHFASVNAASLGSAEVDSEVLGSEELEVSSSLALPEEPSSPQATRDSPRAAPMATVAVSRLNRLVAMVDRFTS